MGPQHGAAYGPEGEDCQHRETQHQRQCFIYGERVSPVSEVSDCSKHARSVAALQSQSVPIPQQRRIMLLRTGQSQWTPGCSRK